MDKKLIWSRYKSTNVNIRTQPAAYATTQRLNTKENLLVLGCSNGDILMYNSNTDRHVAAYNCCSSPIVNLEVKEGLLLTTQRFGATKVSWSNLTSPIKQFFRQHCGISLISKQNMILLMINGLVLHTIQIGLH